MIREEEIMEFGRLPNERTLERQNPLAFHLRSLWDLLDRIPKPSKRLLIALGEMKDW